LKYEIQNGFSIDILYFRILSLQVKFGMEKSIFFYAYNRDQSMRIFGNPANKSIDFQAILDFNFMITESQFY